MIDTLILFACTVVAPLATLYAFYAILSATSRIISNRRTIQRRLPSRKRLPHGVDWR